MIDENGIISEEQNEAAGEESHGGAANGNGLLTVLDIENIAFRKTMRGYDSEQVEDFLEKLAESLQGYCENAQRYERRITHMEDQLKEYMELKKSLQDALVLAQKSAEERVTTAESRAEVITAEAEAEAHRIISNAKERAETHKREIDRLRQVRYQFIAEFKGLISKFGSMLNALEAPSGEGEDRD